MSEPRRWTLNVCPNCGNHQTAFSLCEHQRGEPDGPLPNNKSESMPVREDCITNADVGAVGRWLRDQYEIEFDGVGIPDSHFENDARRLLSTIFKDGERPA